MNYFISKKNDLPEIDKKKFDINPIRILDSKEKVTRKMIIDSPKPIDFLDEESLIHWKGLQKILNSSIKKFENVTLDIDHSLVRGLDYYLSLIHI